MLFFSPVFHGFFWRSDLLEHWIQSYVWDIVLAVLAGLGRSWTHPESWLYLLFHGHWPYQFRRDNSGCLGLMLNHLQPISYAQNLLFTVIIKLVCVCVAMCVCVCVCVCVAVCVCMCACLLARARVHSAMRMFHYPLIRQSEIFQCIALEPEKGSSACSYGWIPPPLDSRALLPTFHMHWQHCSDGSHLAQMGSYCAQNTTTNPCSLLCRHKPLSGICTYTKHPKPTKKRPFFWPKLESGQNNYSLGKVDPNWAKSLKSGQIFSRSGQFIIIIHVAYFASLFSYFPFPCPGFLSTWNAGNGLFALYSLRL